MFDLKILVRLTRIQHYLHVLILIFPLVFLISPLDLFSHDTAVIFLANLFLTAFGYAFNDVEDAEDDYHDVEKRKRNPIASGELSKNKGYIISFLLLFMGLFLLLLLSDLVFFLGLIFTFVGFSYSWRPLRLKSRPVVDLIFHAIFLGGLQFLITYLAVRPLDLFVIPFLMIIIPYSLIVEIFGELEDFDVDKKTNIVNTIQKFERHYVKKLLVALRVMVITGFSIIIFTLPPKFKIINLLVSLSIGVVTIFRMNELFTRARIY